MVKICGLRELPHMLAAAEAGADLLGMVFIPIVRRFLPPEKAQTIIRVFQERFPVTPVSPGGKGVGIALPERALLVGLFADQPVDHVNQVAVTVGLDRVQLCGSEGPDYWAQMQRPVLQVLHIPDLPEDDQEVRQRTLSTIAERLSLLEEVGGLAILDRQSERQPGGLGETFDWTIAQELANMGHHFLLAGGLTPENVGQAITIAQPYGVDVSSGVETDGVKDVDKIQSFIQEVMLAVPSKRG